MGGGNSIIKNELVFTTSSASLTDHQMAVFSHINTQVRMFFKTWLLSMFFQRTHAGPGLQTGFCYRHQLFTLKSESPTHTPTTSAITENPSNSTRLILFIQIVTGTTRPYQAGATSLALQIYILQSRTHIQHKSKADSLRPNEIVTLYIRLLVISISQ